MDYITSGAIFYTTTLSDMYDIFFKVPMNETDGAYFYNEMPAQQLIRWIYEEQNVVINECEGL